MKYAKVGLLILVSLVTGSLLAWVVKGKYDQHYMLEGYFHVVSNGERDHEISLGFPSGRKVEFTLKKGSSFGFKLLNTGEGSIEVAIDGIVRDQVGYVTSSNSMVILVVGEKETTFSQVFPSRITKQDIYSHANQSR